MSDRLAQIETNLKLLRGQQAELEQEAILLTGLPRIRADLTLEEQIKPKIREYEQEYWQVLVDGAPIAEPEAEVAIAEIVGEVTTITMQESDQWRAEVLQLLRQLLDKANQPGTSAVAKFKGIISSFPPFFGITYEAEIDTENFWRKNFPTVRGWGKALAQAAAKK